MGVEPYCIKCYKHFGWIDRCDGCEDCCRWKKVERERREEEERRRREEEEEEERRREEEERIKREEDRRIEERRREERRREERRNKEEEEVARKRIKSLLNSISSSINSISLSDFKFRTSIADKKSFSLKYEKVGNLDCSMKTVGKTYSESIDTSLNRERIYEQKNNYLFTETDELSLDNLRTLKTGREKARFTKKF